MASNPYAQFKKPNPYAVYSTQGAGPKAPTGYAAPGAAAVAAVPGGPEDIHTISRQSSARSGAEQAARIAAERQIIAIQQGTPIAQANLAKAQAEAVIARQKVDESNAEQAIATMAPNSNVHGEAYLKQFVPPAMQAVVKAYARGDLGSRSGGMSTSMLPIIQHAMNYDPSASGVNFPARVKMQSDLASGDPKSAGGSLQAFERMLLHGENVMDAGLKLRNFHSGIASLPLNALRARAKSFDQDPTLASFAEQVRNYAPEAQKAIANSIGGEAERMDRAGAFAGSSSPEALVAGLQGDARQAMGAMQATNDRYKRIMGRDILDAMSPQAKAAYDKIMAGGFDKTGKALLPADGWTPISGVNPPAGGNSGGPARPLPGAGLATGATKAENMPPETAAAITGMIKRGMSAQQINSVLVPAGLIGPSGLSEETITQARKTLAAGGSLMPQFEKPTTLMNRVAGSPVGVGVGSAVDSGLGGFTDEIAGALNPNLDISQVNANKQAAFAEHPRASTIGSILGTGTTALGGGMLLRGAPLVAGLGRTAPFVGGGLYGGISGAGQNNDDRVDGFGLGRCCWRLRALALVKQQQFRSVRLPAQHPVSRPRMGFAACSALAESPTASLSPAEGALFKATNKAGPDVVRSRLDQASNLGAPMSLADTAREITELGASAVRRSPTAAQVAENAFLPRARGQVDRFVTAVGRHLGPIENVPQLSADLEKSAAANAKPHYLEAYAAGQVDDPAINSLFQHPEFKGILADAEQMHANDVALAKARGETPPPPLVKVVNESGEFTPPDVRTIDYVQRALRGRADAAYSGDSVAKMNAPFYKDARNLILSRTDEAVPAFGRARAAYGGPMQSKDALEFGKRAASMDPNALGVEVGNMSGERFGQGQIGFRSQLVDNANKVGFGSNPFEARSTLGTPQAEQRLLTMYPENPEGVANLLATRDMEGGLARSTNDILGNSKTAQRQIADQDFTGPNFGDVASAGVDIAHGGVPVGTVANGLKKAGMFAAKKRAVAKADDARADGVQSRPAGSARHNR
jgi:hypothetical protein